MKRKHAELIKKLLDDDSLDLQAYCNLTNKWLDVHLYAALMNIDNEYRIKPTKPTIDWSHVADEYKWLAIGQYGLAKVFTSKPDAVEKENHSNGEWCVATGDEVRVDAFKSFKAGTCDWKDSLVQRPEGE